MGGGAGHNLSGTDGGADHAHNVDAGCSDDAGTCGGYACASPSSCGSSCTANSGCVSGYTCVTGSCVASAFVNGPCVTVLPDVYPSAYTTAVVFGRGNDSKIHEKTNSSGAGWGAWAALSLDATVLDIRSDLDCGADSSDAIHLVATGTNPLGAFMHATGSGTTFNAFGREFPTLTFTTPGAAIAAYGGSNLLLVPRQRDALKMSVRDSRVDSIASRERDLKEITDPGD